MLMRLFGLRIGFFRMLLRGLALAFSLMLRRRMMRLRSVLMGFRRGFVPGLSHR